MMGLTQQMIRPICYRRMLRPVWPKHSNYATTVILAHASSGILSIVISAQAIYRVNYNLHTDT